MAPFSEIPRPRSTPTKDSKKGQSNVLISGMRFLEILFSGQLNINVLN